jgi:hypothetical protein
VKSLQPRATPGACCAVMGHVHARAGAKLGQAMGRAHAAQAEAESGQAWSRRASGPHRYCATGPCVDSA